MKKLCTKCKKKKELILFYKSKTSKDGLSHNCKLCFANNQRDKSKAINSNEYRNKASLKFRINNFENYIFLAARSRAKKLGIDFDLEISDIVIPELCPYLNVPLTRFVGKGRVQTNPSIERMDNKKGYVKGNVLIVSDLANTMKRDSSIEQLINFAEGILRIYKPS